MLPNIPEDVNLKSLLPLVYDATYHAAQEKLALTSPQWSPSYRAEVDRTHNFTNNTQDVESRKPIPASGVGVIFANQVMQNIRRHEWGKHAYWFIQMRGIKDRSRHEVNDTREIVDNLLGDINRQTSTVFLDVGLEVHLADGYSSLPARAMHQDLAKGVWSISEEEWEKNLHHYQPDVWAANAHIAGFRCHFSGVPVTVNQISYAQVYTSDKFQTYNPSSSSGLLLLASQIIKMEGPDDPPIQINKIYQAIFENQIAQTPTVVRFEARVPSHRAEFVYIHDQEQTELDPVDFWNFIYAVPVEFVW